MPLAGKQKKQLKAVHAVITEQVFGPLDLERSLRLHAKRIRAAESRIRKKIQDRILKSAGIDLDDIERRHAATAETHRKFEATLPKRLKANAELIARRNKRYVDSLKHRAPRPGAPPPPPTAPIVELLNEAASDHAVIEAGHVTNELIRAPWSNVCKLAFHGADPFLSVFFDFMWTPPRDGVLEVTGLFVPNGTLSWAPDHGCVAYDVGITFSAWLVVCRQSPATELASSIDALGEGVASVFQENASDSTPGCGTHSRYYTIQASQVVTVDNLFVRGGEPLFLTAGWRFDDILDGASVKADFSSGAQSLSVPALIVALT